MRELHVEGVATHDDPEPCDGTREGVGEAWDRGTCRPGIEPRNQILQGADAVMRSGRQHAPNREREARCGPARSETPSMYGTCSPRRGRGSVIPSQTGRQEARLRDPHQSPD